MSHRSSQIVLSLVVLGQVLVAGCGGISYRYGTGSVHAIAESATLDAVAVEAIDGRAEGQALPVTGEPATDQLLGRMLSEVRDSVGEHVVRAGLVPGQSALLPAPRTPDEVRATLQRAREAGSSQALFVRFVRSDLMSGCGSVGALALYFGILPWLIIDSIPLWSHGAVGAFEVVVASTETGEILGRSARAAAFAEHVSAWGCGADGVMHDMLRRSLQRALEDVVSQARAGWPRRSGVLAADVILAPLTRLEGSRLVSLGWELDGPAGYILEPHDPAMSRAARLTRSADEHLDVELLVTNDEESNFAGHVFDFARAASSLESEHEVTVSGRPGRRGVARVEGRRVAMLAVAAEGLGYVVRCSGPAELCDPAISSFRITDEMVADGHRGD